MPGCPGGPAREGASGLRGRGATPPGNPRPGEICLGLRPSDGVGRAKAIRIGLHAPLPEKRSSTGCRTDGESGAAFVLPVAVDTLVGWARPSPAEGARCIRAARACRLNRRLIGPKPPRCLGPDHKTQSTFEKRVSE